VGWYGWYAIRRADAVSPATLVGAGGYVGPPAADGSVEIGYSIVADWQGHGYASELAAALVARAWGDPVVTRVVAQTAPANSASVALLRRLGFRESGAGTEPGTARFVLEREGA
jgi:RimJ/RimL family protein N-acetyltransferase